MFECEDSRSTPFSSISDQIASTNPRCVVLDVGLIRQACEISSYILSSQVMRSLLPATDAATPAKPTSPKTGGSTSGSSGYWDSLFRWWGHLYSTYPSLDVVPLVIPSILAGVAPFGRQLSGLSSPRTLKNPTGITAALSLRTLAEALTCTGLGRKIPWFEAFILG